MAAPWQKHETRNFILRWCINTSSFTWTRKVSCNEKVCWQDLFQRVHWVPTSELQGDERGQATGWGQSRRGRGGSTFGHGQRQQVLRVPPQPCHRADRVGHAGGALRLPPGNSAVRPIAVIFLVINSEFMIRFWKQFTLLDQVDGMLLSFFQDRGSFFPSLI